MAIPAIEVTRESLSTNEVFDHFVDADNMVEVTGYIDEIEAQRQVSNGRFTLKRIVISNEERRIQVCFWGDRIAEYDSLLQIRAVLHLDGVLSKKTSLNFWREEHNLIPWELHVQNHSLITAIGNYAANILLNGARAVANAPVIADFNSIASIDSGIIVEIAGAIKSKFRAIATPGRATRYGQANLTNGEYKITIVVNSFTAESQVTAESYEIGDGVTITGTVRIDVNQIIKVVCNNIQSVAPNPDATLTTEEVARGVRPRLHINIEV